MSRSKESRALFRAKEQARRSNRSSSKRPIITPVTPDAMATFTSHVLALAESPVVELNLFSLVEMFEASIDPALIHTAREWMRGMHSNMPLCLCCDTQWLSFADAPPAGFAVVAPFDKTGAVVCSGLCLECFCQPNLMDRCVDRYRRLFGPDLYYKIVSPSPSEVQ